MRILRSISDILRESNRNKKWKRTSVIPHMAASLLAIVDVCAVSMTDTAS